MFQRFLLSTALIAGFAVSISPVMASTKIAQAGFGNQQPDEKARLLQSARDKEDREQFAEAETIWQNLIKEDPNNAIYRYKLGQVLVRQKKLDDAIAAYQTAVKLDPNYAVAYNALGAALAEQEKMDDAIVAFKKALSINENYEEPLKNMGLVLREKGQNAEALPYLERAKTIFQQRGNFGAVRQLELLLQEMRDPRTS